ncbi:receptor protein EIX2 [Trifolium repens]|nr:receptor protein EIX2 [Trifolium repens]
MSQYLEVVILRDNRFEGTIPTQLFNFSKLFHLDLAHNKLSGSIPNCDYNLTQMINFTIVNDDNKVPSELFQLIQVQTLNLYHNNLIGTIPKRKNMESLDLSNNKLCGEIPQSMTLLNFLDYLNLSCNNFDGKIPIGTQLQSFNASYIGNPKLCGAPLNNCTTEEDNHKSRGHEDSNSIRETLYLDMGVGFAAGFWGICGSLFLIRKWRHAYYRFVDRVGDKLYVTLMVKLNSFRRN